MEDLSERIPCSDENCTGILSDEGYCGVCGKRVDEEELLAKLEHRRAERDKIIERKERGSWGEYFTKDDFNHLIERIRKFVDDCYEDQLPVTSSAIDRAIRFLYVLRRRYLLTHINDKWKEPSKVLNSIVIAFNSEYTMFIGDTDEGGISFDWNTSYWRNQVTIPPEDNVEMKYLRYYEGWTFSDYAEATPMYTTSYDKIADRIEKYVVNDPERR